MKLKKICFTAFIMIIFLQYNNAQIPQLVSSNYYGISNLTSFKGLLYFTAKKGDGRTQVYKSDGTEQGTFILKKIQSNSIYWTGPNPYKLIVVNDMMYFTQKDSTDTNKKLWVTDGTESGTRIVKNFNNEYYSYIGFNEMLFFVITTDEYGTELWKTDGTELGTTIVKDINIGSVGSTPNYFMVANNTLFFFAYDSTHGYELWKSDGTESGTVLVKDIFVGANSSRPNYQCDYVAWSGLLFFAANDGIHGREPWITDGTTEGTRMLKDINVGRGSSQADNYCIYNGQIYFTAADLSYPLDEYSNLYNTELYKTDGTAEGTVLIKDINNDYQWGSDVDNLTVYRDFLFFSATNEINNEIYKSDGTASGTNILMDINEGHVSSPRLFTKTSKAMYFKADDFEHGSELWQTYGDSGNTFMVYDLSPGPSDANPNKFTLVDSVLYFTSAGSKLWKIDLLNSISSEFFNSNKIQVYPIPFNDRVFIKTYTNTYNYIRINLYNSLGQKVLENEFYNSETIVLENLNYLESGIYLLEMVSENQVEYQKLIK